MNFSYQATNTMENPAKHRFRMFIVVAGIIAIAAVMTAWTTQQVSAGEQGTSASVVTVTNNESDVAASY